MGDSHAALVRTVLLVGIVAVGWVVLHDVMTPDAPEEAISPAAARGGPGAAPEVPTVTANVTQPTAERSA